MNAYAKTHKLMERVSNRGMVIGFNQLNTLRRAEVTLQRWSEQECGDSNNFVSWAIERDEKTNKPYRVVYPHSGDKVRRYPIADRETGALKRVAAICKELGIYFYHQMDPRGCALYISGEPLNSSNYTNGVALCI